jgi:hypothetical protein
MGPDGTPFQGAFVEAQNIKTRMTMAVLSDTRGHYQIEKLPAGQYQLLIRAVGYRTDPRTGVSLTADQHVSFDFALRKGVVRWNEISFYQAIQLWPAGKGKQLIVANCSICHEFQTRMASVTRDADGWRDRVEYMRTVMHYNLPRLTDQETRTLRTWRPTLRDCSGLSRYCLNLRRTCRNTKTLCGHSAVTR